jgi:(E)-2-((N-methylformamido)methylene)succinate hydrolase
MPEITLNGAKFYYQVSGSGFPVIFTHGLGADHTMWFNQLPVFKESYRTILWDVRGHGRSEVTDGGYSITQFVNDLFALMNHLEIGKAHIAGLSMGGWISWSFAIAHPDRCASLVLSDAAGVMSFTEKECSDMKRVLGKTANVAETQGMEKLIEPTISLMFHPQYMHNNQDMIKLIKTQMLQMDVRGFARTIRGAFMDMFKTPWESIRPSLSGISSPTLVITGDTDALTPLKSQIALHKAIPGSRLEVIEGAGHVPVMEKPEIWNAAVLKFLKETSYTEGKA